MAQILTECLARKMAEDLHLLARLLQRLPTDSDGWHPQNRPGFTIGALHEHLIDAVRALCACFHRLHPDRLRHFEEQRGAGLQQFSVMLAEGFAASQDADLSRTIPTYFCPEGEVFLSVLMSNWKHLHFHTYQLFTYLRELGIGAETKDLYCYATTSEDLPELPPLGHDVIHG